MAVTPTEAAPAPFQPGPLTNRHHEPEPAPKPVEPPVVSPEDEQRLRDARYRNSRGGQVILDPDSDASLGARGGAADTIEGNTLVRDAHLLSHHMDPRDPDASHLPGNVVPAGGEVSDKIGDKHEARYRPVVDKSA
jgi:hypothetical protein